MGIAGGGELGEGSREVVAQEGARGTGGVLDQGIGEGSPGAALGLASLGG